MENFEIVTCCECDSSFRAVGEGQYVTCPYCGAELIIGPVEELRPKRKERPRYFPPYYLPHVPGWDNPLYYDEDMEGAPGFFGGD